MTTRGALRDGTKRFGIALAWLAGFVAVAAGVVALLAWVLPVGPGSWWLARGGAIEVAGCGVATWVVGRRLNRRTWAELGWLGAQRIPSAWLRGVGLGACAAALAIALAAAGGARLAVTPPGAEASVGPIAVGLLLAALSEELVFRGYPLRRLAEAIGPRLAILLLAGGFAAAHLGNPDVTPLAMLNIALAGLWLSLAFFSPGGMASAWGLHFGWNATLGALFGAPVSGYTLAARALHYTPGGPLWLGGGRFGPEGGVVGTIALVAGTVAVLGTRATAPERWVTP